MVTRKAIWLKARLMPMKENNSPILVVDLEATCWDASAPEGVTQSIHTM